MGLDMYLSKRTFIGYENEMVLKIKKDNEWIEIKSHRVDYISENVGEWRYSNQIHKWFVDNCQGGVDDCKRYKVLLSQLKDLKITCEEVLSRRDNNFSKTVLPTMEGPEFGDTDYNDDYYDDIEQTLYILEDVTNHKEIGLFVTFEYQSCW